ncbi:nucleolar protein dao-5-like isoform X2 [Mercenaria mercenaria]|uniref:nucleolar protein dao-5-like isoform X2 n=1 Tax=Mercenaria mercenaria TaxID=6596 RepID=UPI00234EAC7C|nr:nucleolar protein dao-5-like isoform X2 [Mercenaria mercenaria]
MSASVDINSGVSGGMASPVEAEDAFGDDPRMDKKKKFKPFQKMKNFFRGSSKKRFKPEEAGGQKSHSIGALHQHSSGADDDDEGGFRPKSLGLAGSRSISEDSIFKPEPKEQTPGVLENKTVSMENIDTNPFQSELFAKLRSRQSDSDIDEGLPYSPLTTLTAHGLMFDTGRKSVPAAGKSTSQESEQSLISVDGSEEDLFSSNWKSGVASVKTGRSTSLDSLPENQMEEMDFEAVQMRSTSLSNEAAKHRISVKPKTKRLSKKMSMRKRERSPASQLPDVKEEPPTKSQADQEPKQTVPHKTVISTTIPVGPSADSNVHVIPKSEPRDIPSQPEVTLRSHVKDVARSDPRDIPQSTTQIEEKSRPRSLSPLSTSPVSQSMLHEVKLRKRPVSGKFDGEDVNKETDNSENELAKAFNRAKRISKKFDEEGNVVDVNVKPGVKVQEKEIEVKKLVEVTKPVSETKTLPVTSPVKDSPASPVSGVSFVLKKEPLRPGNKTESSKSVNNELKDIPKVAAAEPKATITETPKSVTISTATDAEKAKEIKSTEKEAKVDLPTASPKQGSPEKLASPREEYKLKRAARSKTLPVSKDIMDKSEEVETKLATNRLGSPPLGNRERNDYDSVEVGVKSASIQSKRSSWAPASATTANAAEPAWVVRARLKQMEQEKKAEEDKPDAAKEVKNEVKGASQNSFIKSEKVETVKSANEQKTDIPKGTVQTGGVKSWAQSYSAKPFEKPTVSIASKPNVGVVKTSVHSVKPPVTANLEQQTKATVSVNSMASSNVVASANSKPVATTSAKPTVSSVNKPTVSSTVSKPTVTASAKTAVSVASKPGFAKPLGTASSKSTVTVSAASSADKPTSQISKPTVSVSGTLSSDKPFSQSVKSTSGFGGVSSASSNFSRSFTAKSVTGVQKTGQDMKPASQSSVKPVSISRADSKDSTNKSISVSSITKTHNQDNKKTDNDMKNTSTATSTVKTGSYFDKSKTAFSSTGTKPDTSSAVPPWKQALNQRKPSAGAQQVKIEIIDKDTEKPAQKKVDELRNKFKT